MRIDQKNRSLYEQYAITGWPCHFYTMKACDKYNRLIEDVCQKTPEGARDFSVIRKIQIWFFVFFLDTMDTFWYRP